MVRRVPGSNACKRAGGAETALRERGEKPYARVTATQRSVVRNTTSGIASPPRAWSIETGQCSGTRPPPGAVSPSRKRDQETPPMCLHYFKVAHSLVFEYDSRDSNQIQKWARMPLCRSADISFRASSTSGLCRRPHLLPQPKLSPSK